MDIKIAAGQRLMAGLPGTELDPGFVSLVRECKVGNVILFRRNVKSAAQLERLCTSLRRLIVAETGFEPFIAIDQEGGVVSRFSPDMAITPGAMACLLYTSRTCSPPWSSWIPSKPCSTPRSPPHPAA